LIREDVVVNSLAVDRFLAYTNGGGDTAIDAEEETPTGSGSSVAEASRLAAAP
jgi:hypothetical protein